MVKSEAATADQYLSELSDDRRASISEVRQVILDNLPEGYRETVQFGMISYVVPLETFPKTYNRKPLTYISLASQKDYMSLYLMSIYGDEEKASDFDAEFEASGRKMDRGKSCVRFKKVDDLPMDLIGKTVAGTSLQEYIEIYERSRRR
jgi:uncharacterized protein YdhG (YjbR/CyaY superfamily)